MNRRWRRRLRGPAVALAGGALVTALATTALAAQPLPSEVPAQEPGLTLRVFDLDARISALCTLKPATPNVDRLVPNVDLSSASDFGFEDTFAAQVLGYLTVPQTGTYTFRLVSDDGSRLAIDDQVVVDHDGLHGAEPKDGSVDLGPGYHRLRIDHFERDGGQQLTLQWRTPGSSSFVTVPQSALSTDANVVRVTSPGTKECESGGDSAGDGEPLSGVRPDHTLTDLRPGGFDPQVTGMDFLPDGRLVLTTWGDGPQNQGATTSSGRLYIVNGATSASGPGGVTPQLVATGLYEPMGLRWVDGSYWVSEKDGLSRLTDTNGNGVIDRSQGEYQRVASYPTKTPPNFHEFGFGLLYRDGWFYVNLSVSINFGGATTVPATDGRGRTVRINKDTGEIQDVAGGLRTPNGIGDGPGGCILTTDNQGDWLPVSKLLCVNQGDFFNHYTNPPGVFEDRPVEDPVLWCPQNEICNSPSTPITLQNGRFAGQVLFGDVHYGGIQRASLEQVGGQWQGALFRFSEGFDAGVNRIIEGPDGSIYVGGIGSDGNWRHRDGGRDIYGLERLTPNGGNTLDMLRVRAVPGGFEIDYTKPLSPSVAAGLAGRFTVRQWGYDPQPTYGGPKIDEETLSVTSASLSAAGTTVSLQVSGLQEDRVVYLRSQRLGAADGDQLLSTEAWYTANELPAGTPPPVGTRLEAEAAARSGGASVATDHPGYSGSGFVDGYWNQGAATTFTVQVPSAGSYDAALRYSNGPHPFQGTKTLSVYVNGSKVRQISLASTGTWQTWATATESLPLAAGTNTVSYRYDPGDSANVNLDYLVVGGATSQRITLFDGDDLDQWESTSGGAAPWPVADGSVESSGGDIRTRASFGDYRLHIEFQIPQLPDGQTGQSRGNSGIYLNDRYELQVLDSFGNQPADDEAGGFYQIKAPDSNQATAPLTWQTYDIVFTACRFEGGQKVAPARATVVWNGVTVHDDVVLPNPTGGGASEPPCEGPIRLQDHGDPNDNPRFRNVWVEPIG